MKFAKVVIVLAAFSFCVACSKAQAPTQTGQTQSVVDNPSLPQTVDPVWTSTDGSTDGWWTCPDGYGWNKEFHQNYPVSKEKIPTAECTKAAPNTEQFENPWLQAPGVSVIRAHDSSNGVTCYIAQMADGPKGTGVSISCVK